ncbi:MAG TPA: cation:proton antiporter [Caldimonas sp.]|nr:cation:proton antiporter [Caldimonas sp.]
MPSLTTELGYLALILALLVVPRALQRFLVPAPLSCFAFGLVAALTLEGVGRDTTLTLLATLGISSLFLFAGLEIEVGALRRGLGPLTAHLGVRSVTLAASTWAAMAVFDLPWNAACLLALALMTPSTGFILETLGRLGLDEQERFWVTTKAIGGELLALLVLFVVLQSVSMQRLGWSSAALVAMIALLPVLFTALGRYVVPYAAGSEFSLLVMVGLIAAYLTKQLGVYYLVGAFLVGMVARLLRERMPALASEENLHAVKLFASFFVPFYFFNSGVNVPAGALQWKSLWVGLALAAAVTPFRIGVVWAQRRFLVHEDSRSSLRVAVALAPTLIFTLVLAGILRERYAIPDALYGGLLVYAALTTMLPSLVLSRPFDLDVTDMSPTSERPLGRA